MTTWKAVERKIATLLHGRRVPVTGRGRGETPDIEHEVFSIEVKHRDSLPEWILDGMAQAKASNDGTKIPLVILHGKGMKFDESLAIVELRDIITLCTKAKAFDEQMKERSDKPWY